MHYDFFPGMAPERIEDKLKHIITRFSLSAVVLFELITFVCKGEGDSAASRRRAKFIVAISVSLSRCII